MEKILLQVSLQHEPPRTCFFNTRLKAKKLLLEGKQKYVLRKKNKQAQLEQLLHTFLLNQQGNQTVIHVDFAADIYNLDEILVVHPQHVLITILHEGIVQGHFELCTLLELHFCCATLQVKTCVSAKPVKTSTQPPPSLRYFVPIFVCWFITLVDFLFGKVTDITQYLVFHAEKRERGGRATYSLNESSSDFRSLGIECNSHRSVGDGIRGKALCSFSHVLDCALMILAKN